MLRHPTIEAMKACAIHAAFDAEKRPPNDTRPARSLHIFQASATEHQTLCWDLFVIVQLFFVLPPVSTSVLERAVVVYPNS